MYKNHYMDHAIRVTILTYKLCKSLNVNEEDTVILLVSALLHDIGRKNNSNDIKHGEAGAELLEEIFSNPKIFDIIKNHSIGDRNIHSKYKDLIYILKDADALDRVRSNDLNIKYLRNKESLELIEFAKKLLNLKW